MANHAECVFEVVCSVEGNGGEGARGLELGLQQCIASRQLGLFAESSMWTGQGLFDVVGVIARAFFYFRVCLIRERPSSSTGDP